MKQCTLTVHDEVNIRFTGLDPKIRRELSDKLKYFLQHARHMPAFRLGRWDGCVRFFDVGGRTYLNLLPEIVPILEKHNYSIDVIDMRIDFEADLGTVTKDTFSDITWPKGHPIEGQPIVLMDHQVEVINGFLGDKQCLQEVATGAGKTLITAVLSKTVEQYGRSIVVVPNKSLVTQTEEDYINLDLDVGVFYGDRKEYNKTHTICTWQSLNILMKKTKRIVDLPFTMQDFIEGVCCVIIDECLDGDTMIDTPTGKKKIKDFQAGDSVVSYNEDTGEFVSDTVVKLHVNLPKAESADMYELTMEDGSSVKITGNHKVLTERGWIEAQDLEDGDEVVSL